MFWDKFLRHEENNISDVFIPLLILLQKFFFLLITCENQELVS